ncbi:MAG TPA: hypothetical protein ENK91_11450 [Bacteroidetes bacterium]|nr:hypothetical protein [Bacteroidota bacterium]
MNKKNKYINPYLGGFLLGLLIIVALYFSGEGLGSSGGYRDVAVAATDFVAPEYAHENTYIGPRLESGESPLKTWLVFELLGVIFGAVLSAALFNRLKFSIGKAPHITNRRRLWLALIGGALWGVGTQLGRGCTSGLVLSGMAVNSLSGYIGLIGIFGFGFIFAFIFKSIWIKTKN